MNSMQKVLATAALSAVAVLVGCEQGKVPVAPEATASAKANTADALASAPPKAVGALAENWTKLQGAKGGEDVRKLLDERKKIIEELSSTNSPNVRKVLKGNEAKARIDYFREKFRAEKRANPDNSENNWFSEQTVELGKNGERINSGGSFTFSYGSYAFCMTEQEFPDGMDEISVEGGSWTQTSQTIDNLDISSELLKNGSYIASQGDSRTNTDYIAVGNLLNDIVPQGQTAYAVKGYHIGQNSSITPGVPGFLIVVRSGASRTYNNVPMNPR